MEPLSWSTINIEALCQHHNAVARHDGFKSMRYEDDYTRAQLFGNKLQNEVVRRTTVVAL